MTIVPCEAGCHAISAQVEHDEELVYLSFYVGTFYSGQDSVFKRWRARLALAWAALRGRDYLFHDVVLSQKHADELAFALKLRGGVR